jgi:hypothetical protein
MRTLFAAFLMFVIGGVCVAQGQTSNEQLPTEIVIGRDSFIDVGPPFDYYDLTFLRADGSSTNVDRISLTPAADTCYPRAEIKVISVSLKEPLASVLGGTNPCTIPEKALKEELKRRNKEPVFSGMDVSIQVECGGRTRVIRADILDRDIFDQHPSTPQYTAWSRALFDKLDQATGDHPWETPIFPVSQAFSAPPATSQSAALQAIAEGKFDGIFGNAPDRPSALYHMAQNPPRQPFIELTSCEPVRPASYVDPVFPPIARAARVHGSVEFHLVVGDDGATKNVAIDSGPGMLRQAVIDAVTKWKFPAADAGKAIQGSIRFGLNCADESK